MNPIIKIDSISKRYTLGTKEPYYSLRDSLTGIFKPKKKPESFWALKDVSFEVARGETIGIIGRNGAGKSTLLKILSRITPPTHGTITMKGRVASLLEVGTGFNPELTGRENIYLNGAILGMTQKEIGRKFDEIVAFAEIDKFLDTPVKRYSSGMYVRLAFAVAAHLEPEILIVDEVLAVGDAQFQKKCLGKMGEVAKGGRTVLFVSHNMGAVKSLCKRGVLFEKGELVRNGTIDEVVDDYIMRNIDSTKNNEYEFDASKVVQIRKVTILDSDGKLTTEVDISKSFSIQVECDIREDIDKTNFIGIHFYDVNNNFIMQSLDLDSNEKFYRYRSKGVYKCTFQFPENTFNEFMCKIKVVAGVKSAHHPNFDPEKYFDQKDDVYFNFIKVNHFSKKFFNGQRFGYLSMATPCRIEKK